MNIYSMNGMYLVTRDSLQLDLIPFFIMKTIEHFLEVKKIRSTNGLKDPRDHKRRPLVIIQN